MSRDSFLEAYRTIETKDFFPYEYFNVPEKQNKKQLPDEASFNKSRNNNLLEKDCSGF